MIEYYSNPALDAELAYRRELAMLAAVGQLGVQCGVAVVLDHLDRSSVVRW